MGDNGQGVRPRRREKRLRASLGPQVYDKEDGGEDEHQDNNPADQETDESTVADQWFAHGGLTPALGALNGVATVLIPASDGRHSTMST